MKTKKLTLNLPSYLTTEQYMNMSQYKGDSQIGRMIHVVSSLTGIEPKEVRTWNVNNVIEVANVYSNLADHKEEFHAIIEWNDQLLGYAHMNNSSLGEYQDIEKLAQNMEDNLHKIAAILYRPIQKHRFNTISFTTRQTIKMANNKVENVFDYYTVEKYDADTRRDREEQFKNFPSHILLGAISFFLSTGSLYLNSIAYSEKRIDKKTKERHEKLILKNLSHNIGAGGALFTTSLSPTYYRLQEEAPSSILTQ
jgi:hypothetical protein